MNPNADLLAALAPLTRAIAALDLTQVAAAESALNTTFPPAELAALDALFRAAEAAGTLTPRRATPTLTFGRLCKPTEASLGFAIDTVDMAGEGGAHVHPRGEVSLCFAREGSPTFEGRTGGFVVMPPGSAHVPTVVGGRMVIAYWLAGGEIVFQ